MPHNTTARPRPDPNSSPPDRRRHGRRTLHVLLVAATLLAATARMASAQEHAPEPGYEDDRSTPEATIRSLYDAVNRREYARAYSYWEPTSADLPSFDDFQQGYADTLSVDVTMGDVGSGVGAGQLFFSVPVTLLATRSDASTQTFVGCYILHLARPQIQAVPPFHPMGIQRASVFEVADDADTATLMQQACGPL